MSNAQEAFNLSPFVKRENKRILCESFEKILQEVKEIEDSDEAKQALEAIEALYLKLKPLLLKKAKIESKKRLRISTLN